MYKIQQGSEDLNSNGGIALAGALLNGLKNLGKIDSMKMGNIKKGWTSHSGIVKSAAGLLVLGRSDFADIELFREDQLFRDYLGLRRVPPEGTLRQRLDAISKENNQQTRDGKNVYRCILSHIKLKSDMGVERLPSGKFATNALILNLATLAYNCLRILGQRALKMTELLPRKFSVARRRLRSVMQDLIHIACKIVSHSNRKYLKFGRNCPWFNVFKELYATC